MDGWETSVEGPGRAPQDLQVRTAVRRGTSHTTLAHLCRDPLFQAGRGLTGWCG